MYMHLVCVKMVRVDFRIKLLAPLPPLSHAQESLNSQLRCPDFLLADFAKMEAPLQTHLSFLALDRFIQETKRLPKPRYILLIKHVQTVQCYIQVYMFILNDYHSCKQNLCRDEGDVNLLSKLAAEINHEYKLVTNHILHVVVAVAD